MTPTVTIEPIVDRAGYERAVLIRNPFVWVHPATADEVMSWAEQMPDVPRKRFLVLSDGQDVGYVTVIQVYWSDDPYLYSLNLSHRFGEGEKAWAKLTLDAAEDAARGFGADRFMTWVHTDCTSIIGELEGRGYVSGQRNPVTALDATAFDPSPYEERVEAVKRAGFQILTMAELEERWPEEWRHRVWRHEMEVFKDVPLSVPFKETPFEQYSKELDNPLFDRTAQFYAVHGETIAASSGLFPNRVDPTLVSTGLTGTLREYRRRGLATALKVTGLMEAKRRGARKVFTDNEQNNPMLSLNLELGFRPIIEMVEYSKKASE